MGSKSTVSTKRGIACIVVVCALLLGLSAIQPSLVRATTDGWAEAGTCEWVKEGKQLVIRPAGGGDEGTLQEWSSASESPWSASRTEFTSVKVEPGVRATSCAYLFAGLTKARTFDLSGLDTSAVEDFSYMFSGCTSMARTYLDDVDFSSATKLSYMFSGCTALAKADLSSVKAPRLADLSYVFYNCADLQELELEGIETGVLKSLVGMFWSCGKLQSVDVRGLDTSHVTSFSHLFASCGSLKHVDAESIDTTSAQSFACMFQQCRSLTSLNVAGWNTKNLKSLENAFSECDGLRTLDFAKWDLSNLVTAKMMFEGDNHLESVDLTSFKSAGKLEDVYAMFNQCVSLRSVNVHCMDFSHLKVDGLAHFLDGCIQLKSIDMSGASFGRCADPVQMFSGCTGLVKASLRGARFEHAVSFLELFANCTSLKTVDFSHVYAPLLAEMNSMFTNCKSLETVDFTGSTFGTITAASNMFKDCSSLKSLDLSGIQAGAKKFATIFYGCYADSYKPMQGFTAAGPKAHPSISSASIARIADVKFSGKYFTPAVKVSVPDDATYTWGDMWGKTLTQGKHYAVTYSNNRKVGTATVTIKGIGIFRGTVQKTFKILPK